VVIFIFKCPGEPSPRSLTSKEFLAMISKQLPFFYIPISHELDKMFADVKRKLDNLIETLQVDVNQKQAVLEQYHTHPELIDDPIKLFRLALRRHELLVEKSQS
jgi:hypothetical protein